MGSWCGLFSLELLQSERSVDVMLRGALSHTLLTTLLASLFLTPPALGWRGVLDCAKRCHLARTAGAHCPLTYGAQQTKSAHHCHEQHDTQPIPQYNCSCPHSSSPASD